MILVAEDDADMRYLIEMMLRLCGHSFVSASDGDEALEQFRESPQAFGLVITDYQMPMMNGDELLVKLRSIRADIPMILYSGSNDITSEMAQTWGFNLFLSKPVTLDVLRQHVHETMIHD